MTTTTDDVTHLRALLAEQTARAERAEALVAEHQAVTDAHMESWERLMGRALRDESDRMRAERDVAQDAARSALAALAYAADRRGTQFDFDEWMPLVVAALGREPAPLPPHTNPRAEKAEARAEHEHAEMQRQAKLAVDWMIDAQRALAANAEMRAALEEWHDPGHAMHPATCRTCALLSRPDLGAGMVVVPREAVAAVVDALQHVPRSWGRTSAEVRAIAVLEASLAGKKGGG